jgi:hypothetical protein
MNTKTGIKTQLYIGEIGNAVKSSLQRGYAGSYVQSLAERGILHFENGRISASTNPKTVGWENAEP